MTVSQNYLSDTPIEPASLFPLAALCRHSEALPDEPAANTGDVTAEGPAAAAIDIGGALPSWPRIFPGL